jgi:hypothetical protein
MHDKNVHETMVPASCALQRYSVSNMNAIADSKFDVQYWRRKIRKMQLSVAAKKLLLSWPSAFPPEKLTDKRLAGLISTGNTTRATIERVSEKANAMIEGAA